MNKYLYAVIQIEIEFCFLMKTKKKKSGETERGIIEMKKQRIL